MNKEKFISGGERLFKIVDKIAFAGAAASVALMLFCVTLQVIASMTALMVNWTAELSQYAFLWTTTFASYIAARRKKLIGVGLIQNMMPALVKKIMQSISWATCGLFYAIVIYYNAVQMPRLMKQVTPILKWPMGMIYIIMMIGFAMLTLYAVYLAIYVLIFDESKVVKKEKTAAEIAEEVE